MPGRRAFRTRQHRRRVRPIPPPGLRHFLRIAIGSLKEVHDLLIDGHERRHVTEDELAHGTRLVKRSTSACAALARYLLNSPDAL
jgi:hypothetical protein